MNVTAVGTVCVVLGLFTFMVTFGTYDEQKRRGVMFEGPFWKLGMVGARTDNHAYIEYGTPTFHRYQKAGWVLVGVEHSQLGWRDVCYAHLTEPNRVCIPTQEAKSL